jgi:hypothetical protein
MVSLEYPIQRESLGVPLTNLEGIRLYGYIINPLSNSYDIGINIKLNNYGIKDNLKTINDS